MKIFKLIVACCVFPACAIIPKNEAIYNLNNEDQRKFYCAKLNSITIKDNGVLNPEDRVTEDSVKCKKWFDYYAKYFTERDSSGNECRQIQKVNVEINLIHSNNFLWAFFHGFTLGIIPFWQDTTREIIAQSEQLACSSCINAKSIIEYTIYSSIFLTPTMPFRKHGLVETSDKIHDFQMYELISSTNNTAKTKP